MKKIIAVFLIFITLGIFVGISSYIKEDSIVIYTSTEDYNMSLLKERLEEKFPKYKIDIEYMSTSTVATKAIEEGENCEADIIYCLEYSFVEKIVDAGNFANLRGEYDLSIFQDDVLYDPIKDYSLPNQRTGGGIIINKQVLQEKGLSAPASYEDLLKPEYRGLISMPSPKASSTGYIFYLSLVNIWGEEATIDYFNKLAENVNQFSSSGSGPINFLVNREIAIGLGMITAAAEKITKGNNELEILIFEEGAPFGLYGSGIIKGREKNTAVMEVFDYLCGDFTIESCAKYYPEPIFNDIKFEANNFPENIVYSDMSGNSAAKKEYLLSKWTH